jgi:hypothetical protein
MKPWNLIKGDPATLLTAQGGEKCEIFYNEKTNKMTTIGGGQIEEGSTILSYENLLWWSDQDGKWEGHVAFEIRLVNLERSRYPGTIR